MEAKSRKWLRPVLVVAFVALGAAFVWIGIVRGEMRIVENKAIRICLECVGIG